MILVASNTPAPRVVEIVPRLPNRGGGVFDLLAGPSTVSAALPEQTVPYRPPSYLRSPADIPIAAELMDSHPFEALIRQPDLLSAAALRSLIPQLRLSIPISRHGAIPASFNGSTDYDGHSWLRDSSLCTYALWRVGLCSDALRGVVSWNAFFNTHEQRDRFLKFHFHSDPVGLYRHGPRFDLPHIRAAIGHHGAMHQSNAEWSHNQLDAVGMWLSNCFELGLSRAMDDLKGLNRYLTRKVNDRNDLDSILCVGLRFLSKVNFWDQIDTAAWEDHALPQRGTSIAACLSAFKKAEQFFKTFGWDVIQNTPGTNGRTLRSELEEGIALGEEALRRRVPLDGSMAIETDEFRSDAAYVFSLYPFNPGYTRTQEDAILTSLYRDRMTPFGFTRRDRDYYLGADYAHRHDGEGIWSDGNHPDFEAAAWTFDGFIAAFYYDRFARDGVLGDLALADRHAKRCLSQFTKETESFVRVHDGREVVIPALRLPEARWRCTKTNVMRPNHNTPLFMTEAGFLMMIERADAAFARLEERAVHN